MAPTAAVQAGGQSPAHRRFSAAGKSAKTVKKPGAKTMTLANSKKDSGAPRPARKTRRGTRAGVRTRGEALREVMNAANPQNTQKHLPTKINHRANKKTQSHKRNCQKVLRTRLPPTHLAPMKVLFQVGRKLRNPRRTSKLDARRAKRFPLRRCPRRKFHWQGGRRRGNRNVFHRCPNGWRTIR